ncbi:MbtH family protein [Vibrio metschnikovii]|uniref:MbtH family protein n=3 Tax=Unclassified Bacteria TaxID=49928 RepID=A0AAU6T256_UNCXX|nr:MULTISPECIES: MbtH family protein [Vibrio]EKO3556709.1 MbtH family protein [Vibrio metschnikovii]EKO3569128.1 MbtH family protein [Vibrio metschnikovii]EKO3570834.1 MbtH family protein [Vibrio metschnikovii]EKO3575781.1 MbtH family protein [Vibrio metschnikovii]EKO3577900.1 MbtH family protein [Vibrio metschnikovii]
MSEQYVNPFDNTENQFTVLINHHGQYSLWPEFKPTPSGWKSTFGPSSKQRCIEYIEANWHDIRV